MRARRRTCLPLVLLALFALLLMPHQAGTHSGTGPAPDAAGHAMAAVDTTVAAVVEPAGAAVAPAAGPLVAALAGVTADLPALLSVPPSGSDALLLALGCAVMMLALVLLPRPGPHRATAGTASAARPPVRAPRARGAGPPRDLLVELCVSRT